MQGLANMSVQDLMALMMQQGGGGGGGQQYQQQYQQPGRADNDWFCTGCADKQFAKNAQCRNCGTARELGVSDVSQIPDVIDKFLGGKVDAQVDMAFRNLPGDMQKVIIERGSLMTARDPSAVLRTRMSQAAQGGGGASQGFGGGGGGFKAAHDPQAPRAGDWYCSNCGDLQFGKNASCRRCGLPREQVDQGKPELDPVNFLAPFAIDEDKKVKFLSMEPELQEQIMLKGSLAGARDPTAVLCQRMGQAIQNAKGSQQMGGGGGGHGPRVGDWYCSICHDLQFAKNESCRTCNTPRAMADTGEVPQLDAVQWVSMFQIDEDKKQQFLSMDPSLQEAIIADGTLHGARDPTAVLVSRMSRALKGGCGKGGGGGFGPAGGKANHGASPYGGGGADGGDEAAWVAYAKGFLQAMKGKGGKGSGW